MKFLFRFIIMAVAVYVTALFFSPDIQVIGAKGAIIVSVVMGLLNTFVKPIVKIFALPVTIVTLGLFSLVINALFVMLCGYLVPESFHVAGFVAAFLYSIVLSVLNWLLNTIAGTK